jgi:endo-1,4-beta-xylanase
MTRRECILAVASAAALPPTSAARPARCIVLDAQGEPVAPDAMVRFHTCDLLLRPFTLAPVVAVGQITFSPPAQPFRISLPLQVPGFGHVFVYADNRGAGYTPRSLAKSGDLLLNYEFAADRLTTVRRLAEDCRSLGVTIPSGLSVRISAAEELLQRAEVARGDHPACARAAMESLRESLWAGEGLVFERAKYRIAKQSPRPGFLFGSNAFGFASGPEWYREYYTKLLNYGTIPFYRGMLEREKDHPDYSEPEAILNAVDKAHASIMIKGHPLIFLVAEATPKWLKNLPFEETNTLCIARVREAISRLRSRVHIWDVINEAHVQPETGTDMVGFTREQNVEMTVSALQAARDSDPTCYRVVNNTGTWSDYYMAGKPAVWQQCVYDYLTMVRDAGANYEAIGLQYYHSGRDMVEFERNLDLFQAFGKPVHLTELGISSSSTGAEKSEWWGGGPGGAKFVWHGEQFTESSQADWFEQVYTIGYSKPWVQAISTWDFSDPAFIPHGGLLREDGTPKESYQRLTTLLADWRTTRRSPTLRTDG